MQKTRRQLTLFLSPSNEIIEVIRAKYNPVQFKLIPAHVTLCREDEIEPIEPTIQRLESIRLPKPLRIEFKAVQRFAEGKGVFIPAKNKNVAFDELRKAVLGPKKLKKEQFPHITLMHPRNSTCTDQIFKEIQVEDLPTELFFKKISLIEQLDGGKWNVIREFDILS